MVPSVLELFAFSCSLHMSRVPSISFIVFIWWLRFGLDKLKVLVYSHKWCVGELPCNIPTIERHWFMSECNGCLLRGYGPYGQFKANWTISVLYLLSWWIIYQSQYCTFVLASLSTYHVKLKVHSTTNKQNVNIWRETWCISLVISPSPMYSPAYKFNLRTKTTFGLHTRGWLVWPCFHQPACTSIYITSDRQVGSTTSWGLKEIACFVCNHLPLLRHRDLVQWIMSTPYCPMLSTTTMTTNALQNLTH